MTEVPAPLTSNSDYEVGYGKPPAATRFKPGRSGNPKGRPKGAVGLTTIVRDMMHEKIVVRTARGTKKIRHIEALLRRQLEMAVKGDLRAITLLTGMYRAAVPDAIDPDLMQPSGEELSREDQAILEDYQRTTTGTLQTEARS
jgi:hypothetical protein